MSDVKKKRLASADPDAPQPDGSGEQEQQQQPRRRPAPGIKTTKIPSIQRTLDQFEGRLRKHYGAEIERDPKKFRCVVLASIARRFRLRRGRRPDKRLDLAETLRASGCTLDHACRVIEPDYALWDRYRRLAYRQSIESGLRKRRQRQKQKDQVTRKN